MISEETGWIVLVVEDQSPFPGDLCCLQSLILSIFAAFPARKKTCMSRGVPMRIRMAYLIGRRALTSSRASCASFTARLFMALMVRGVESVVDPFVNGGGLYICCIVRMSR